MGVLSDKIDALPQELQELFDSDAVDETLEALADKYDIDEGWRGEFFRPVYRVLAGDLSPKKFIGLLKKNLALEDEEALALARDVNKEIFIPVKPYLAELYAIEDEKIARKLRVPRKPKEVIVSANANSQSIIDAPDLPAPESVITPKPKMTPEVAPEVPSLDTAPIEIVPPPAQPTFAPEEPKAMTGAVPSPLTAHFAAEPAVIEASSVVASVPVQSSVPLQRPADLPASKLAQKLGGMRTGGDDPYRETF